MNKEIKENPAVVEALKEENEELPGKFIKAKTIMNIGIFLFLLSFVAGLYLIYALPDYNGLVTFIASIITGAVLLLFSAIAAEIVYQLQKINSKK